MKTYATGATGSFSIFRSVIFILIAISGLYNLYVFLSSKGASYTTLIFVLTPAAIFFVWGISWILTEHRRVITQVTIQEDRTMEFLTPNKTIKVPLNEIVSIKAANRSFFSPSWAEVYVKHSKGTISLMLQKSDVQELAATAKSINPAILTKGCQKLALC